MNFIWNMRKVDWERMRNDHIERLYDVENVYGQVMVGTLSIEFIHTMDDSDWYLFTEVFEYGKNTGYGYTMENHVPYDMLDCYIRVPFRCKTFESFKTMVVKEIKKMIKENHLEEQANAPLADWK